MPQDETEEEQICKKSDQQDLMIGCQAMKCYGQTNQNFGVTERLSGKVINMLRKWQQL